MSIRDYRRRLFCNIKWCGLRCNSSYLYSSTDIGLFACFMPTKYTILPASVCLPVCMFCSCVCMCERTTRNVSKGAKIRNRYNQVPHLTQDTNGKLTNSQQDATNESKEASPPPPPPPAGDHMAHTNRRSQRHNNTRHKKHKRSTKEAPPWNGQ